MRIVTSGYPYLDIDAYGGCVAYAELLQTLEVPAAAVSKAPLNESISKTVLSWRAPLLTDYQPSPDDTFTLIDVSDPAYFDKFVNLKRVTAVIDHHLGFEDYWNEQLGDKSNIEFIGAACTLVYECWKDAEQLDKISPLSARLLICGILDNTLNFGAHVTTPRDVEAAEALLARANLPDDWTAQYFTECQEAVLQDVATAIKNDTKTLSFKSFPHPVCFGQLVVWDGQKVLAGHQDVLKKALSDIKPDWFLNLISVGEKKSYFVTDNNKVKKWLANLLELQFKDSVAIADRMWLRKEVIKQDLSIR